MILEGVLAIANGENPHNIEMKLQSFLEKGQKTA
jgi:flagellar motor component MotA